MKLKLLKTPKVVQPPREEMTIAENKLKEGLAAASESSWDDAISLYMTGLESDPTNALIFYNLGNAYFNVGKLEESYLAYKDAVHYNPNLSKAWNNLGIVQEERGFSDEAISSYEKAIEIDNYLDGHYNLGMLLEKKGRYEQAIPHFREYIKRDPGSEWGKKAADHLKQLNLR